MRNVSQLSGTAGQHFPEHLALPVDVEEFPLHLHRLTARHLIDLADHQILLCQNAPVAVVNLTLFGRHAQHVGSRQRPELAHLLQVIGNDLSQIFIQASVPLPIEWYHRNRDRVIDPTGNFDIQFGCTCPSGNGGKNHQNQGEHLYRQMFHQAVLFQFSKSSGRNVSKSERKLRSNILGGMPCSSEKRPTARTAFSAERSNAGSPLDLTISTSTTSPVGTIRIRNTASMLFLALGGRDQLRWTKS